MTEEINDGIAYLLALKQSGSAAKSAAAVELQPSPDPAPDSQHKGAEKRRSPRYKCEGSAQICEDGRDVPTWASFTDISLHGCYLEAQATYPTGTLLHMKMEASGVRLETQGIVRVTYPYLGMGVAFNNMSEENVVLLKRLLAVVSRPCLIMGPGIASSLPATDPLGAIPVIAKPEAAVAALIEFFESRQMLLRDDFIRLLKKSQGSESTAQR